MPKKKYEIFVSQRAQNDFKSIQRYTNRTHGHRQTEIYLDAIEEKIEFLAENPLLYGHYRPDIPERYRACSIGEHNVIFRVEAHKVFIVAILHGSMDFITRLKD